ncbi:pentapeptide repeat-containing protein [Nostoc sp. UCD121]|uniref:pentapeptide repeat-containing protein n=1 Tax=unclassified Nostoc TaxID=2593658 RepID=UPI001627E0CB|nr:MULTISPECIES: pentapeptide repeat-containing protein [unclassified Nostoc]MBC1219168.1 pentapeptide repeat-containing protein [Nostoc sp. UCD120]MBC1277323.1 pentapeptide repeat-containing protein [Nostoc sp. UCD121]MBC1295941.1 pentapeptide repeat-containing protein [Nostoc sp. UCD122]
MNGKELLTRYAAGERDFSGVDLKGANLSGVSRRFDVGAYDEPYRQGITSDLSGINLTCADLNEANLTGVNLEGANLSNANLTCANLNQSNLTNVDLSGANLSEAFLECAELDGTNMRWANLFRAEIRVSDVFCPDLTGAKNVDTVNFTGGIIHLTLEDGTVIDTTDNDW